MLDNKTCLFLSADGSFGVEWGSKKGSDWLSMRLRSPEVASV